MSIYCKSPQLGLSRLDYLPPELRYYIAEYVHCTNPSPYPYLPLYKNIVLDWYNKRREWDTMNHIICHNYDEIYKHTISADQLPCMKYAFRFYAIDSKYYSMNMIHRIGQFEKIPIRRKSNKHCFVT
jgi:hypothetical protein